jgi:inositol 1,4,5-triphosphate receptor type 3
MIFYIVIVLILGNIFLGVIVDTFAELRDTKSKSDNDQNNVCYICQISRNNANLKLIDFDEHVKNDHNIWNYVDFIIYLLINNTKEFNRLIYYSYDKLKNNDITWFPFEE